MTPMVSRGRTVGTLVLVALLILSTAAPTVALPALEPTANEGRIAIDPVRMDLGARATATQADPEFAEAAREGARRGIAEAEAAGIAVTPAMRAATIQGAELAAALSASGISFPVDGTGSTEEPQQVSAEHVRAAARGAAFGALASATQYRPTDQVLSSSVAGATAGAVLSGALVPTQGGLVTPAQIRAAAHGGAQGTALAAGEVSAGGPITVAPDVILTAAFGGAGGAVAATGLLPIYGGSAAPIQTYGAALGGASGALVGTQRVAARLPVDANGTASAALGASAGAAAAVLHRPDLEGIVLYRAARETAIETLSRPDLATPEQLSEAALTGAYSRLVDLPRGNALFSQPLRIAGQVFPIGPPADPDADGRYEDVNGNGVLSYSDVVTLAIVYDAWANGRVTLSNEQIAAFDFNGDGVFDKRDTRSLNEEITGGP